jgi:uridine kinase
MSPEPFVLAIAGTSGAGKSTIVDLLGKALDGAAILRFDDYADEDTYPGDFQSFIDRGCPLNELKSARFVADVQAWRAGHAVTPPHTDVAVEPAKILILEEPTGRSRDVMRPLVDYVFYLDLPYDIALARRLLRLIETVSDADSGIQAIRTNLGWFMTVGHVVYRAIGQQVMAEADLLVNGLLKPEAIVDQIVETLRSMNVVTA